MEDAFTAGIRPGGLNDKKEIRIIICHILSSVAGPMSFEELMETLLADGTMNYFELVDALTNLVGDGLVEKSKTESGIGIYSASKSGREAADGLVDSLPGSVVEKAVNKARSLVNPRVREKENTVVISATPDGYKIHMAVTDIGTNLMELSLFMPSKEQAEKVRKRFLDNPTKIYAEILRSMAGDF